MTPEEAALAYLRLGSNLLSLTPRVLERDAEKVIEDLATWRALQCRPRVGLSAIGQDSSPAYQVANLEMLCLSATSDPVAWTACGILAKWYSDRGMALPDSLQKFAARALCGDVQRPTPGRGRTRYANYYRDLAIRGAVVAAVNAGLNPTRNDASVSVSACDVVVACLEEFGIPMTYDNVKKIYGKGAPA